MYRSVLCIIAVLAGGCAGQRPRTAVEIDHRAELLTRLGQWDEAAELVARGLTDARSRGDEAAEARLLMARGRTLVDRSRHRGGDRAPALVDLEAARRKAEAAGDRVLTADSIDGLGLHRFYTWFSTQNEADLETADKLFRDALAIRTAMAESPVLAQSYFHVGLVHEMRGQYEQAREVCERAYAVAERAHDALWMSYAVRDLAYLAERRGAWAEAENGYRRSLELREQVGAVPLVASAQVALAELRYARDGNADQALALLARAHEGAARVRSGAYVAISSEATARVHRDHGQYDEALRDLADAIRAMGEIGSDEDVPESYEQMALVHLLRGNAVAALAEAERGIARRSTPRLQAVQSLARARAGQPASAPTIDAKDPVVAARLALAAGDASAALEAAVRGDDPDTLVLAMRTVGATAFDRARAAAAKMSRAQELRFEREIRALSGR